LGWVAAYFPRIFTSHFPPHVIKLTCVSGIQGDTTPYTYSNTHKFLKIAPLTDAECVTVNKDILWDTIKGLNTSQSAVTTNLTLSTSGVGGATISWVSTDTAITTDGTVTRLLYANGDTTVTLTATITKGSVSDTKAFAITVVKDAPSNGAALASRTISAGILSPAFATTTTSYTAEVANTISSVTIGGAATNAYAHITGVGTKALAVGENECTITVTAEDGTTTKTYTITITRDAPIRGAWIETCERSPNAPPCAVILHPGGVD
jgi:hypothetical protein